MCNPRRVRVRASSRLTRMWQEELRRTGRASAEVAGEATLREEFGTLLGAPARRAFEDALGADTRWTWQDGAYRLDMDGGTVVYHLDTGEIEMTARLSDVVTAEAEVTRTLQGTVDVNTTAEHTARYYDDSWAGLSKSVAERTARAQAQERADRDAAEQVAREEEQERLAGRRRLAGQRDEIDAEARAEAERRAAAEAERRREELERDAEAQLRDARTGFLRPVHEVLAVAYRDAIVAYAREHGVQDIQVDDTDGTLNIQFEMEA
ncbi:hypothetical protein GCM10010260_51270 [Streptomyces filipinensis]|uniref:FtsH ternary system domain-containing protein n=1 Tax=Streptomyces filipinensis TaxID=66887 RepID=A0A918IEQ1_9ACTN|nr:hypothetical protein [Streptomyces filipinensis]GGV07310.1 hypothetical protein GCM10010260_51270 [Streptomyces filipinensis]